MFKETRRIFLSPFSSHASDISTLYGWARSRDYRDIFSDFVMPPSESEVEAWALAGRMMKIHHKDMGNLVGAIWAQTTNARAGVVKISLLIDKGWQRQGLGTEAFYIMLDHLLNWLNVRKIIIDTVNPVTVSFLEKHNFDLEGMHRSEYFRDGGFLDIYRYGIFKREALEVLKKLEESPCHYQQP